MDHKHKYRFIGRSRWYQNLNINVYEWRCHACKSTVEMFVQNFWKVNHGHGC